MTTIAELRRDEKKQSAFLLDVLEAANTLDKAERDIDGFYKSFKTLSDHVKEVTGLGLWSNGSGGRFFWRADMNKNVPMDSVEYPDRSAAIRALIDGTIEWT